ncbi:hypothetical protein C8F01DRAFT_985409 [Mycena amicta]|nr:hypothetical protein C8F01DRAFT_985409 [Mycena amicta]
MDSKTLTPQRKHRKLLKDGSGTAVWPENVEQIFVQGLRDYLDSPWASYSKGRSRWRNQYLVDYLATMGIVRSKKQVASHIQVLRNMWKGEPEYNLVAGADELFQDSVKLEDNPSLLTIDDDDDASSASNSPAEQATDFPPPGLSYSPTSPLSSIPDIIDSPPHTTLAHLAAPYPYVAQQKSNPHQPRYPNRTTTFTLLAEGMTPFIVSLDKLSPPAALPARTPPLTLRLRLSVPAAHDPRAPASLHGFFASVRLAAIWSGHAKVFTRVYDPAGCCAATDEAPLHASSIDLGTVVAGFPESTLTRARWRDPTTQATITQQLVVDNVTLLFVVYDLDSGHSMPSVEFVSFQKYAGSSDARATTAPVQSSAPMYYYTPYIPSTPSSLSAALTPIS